MTHDVTTEDSAVLVVGDDAFLAAALQPAQPINQERRESAKRSMLRALGGGDLLTVIFLFLCCS